MTIATLPPRSTMPATLLGSSARGSPSPHHGRGQLPATGLVDRPRAPRERVFPRACAPASSGASTELFLEAGSGRRDAACDPRPGASRSRRDQRRRDAAGELLEPVRNRPRRRRPRQPGRRARPHRPREPGSAGGRTDSPDASGRGARRRVPAREHRTGGSRSRCPGPSRWPSRRRTTITRTRPASRSPTPRP